MARQSLACKVCGDCADWNILRESNGKQVLKCNTCGVEVPIDRLQTDYSKLSLVDVVTPCSDGN